MCCGGTGSVSVWIVSVKAVSVRTVSECCDTLVHAFSYVVYSACCK